MTDVLAALRKAGITLEVDGDTLVARPRAALTDELRVLIRDNKGVLMDELGIEVIRQAFGIEPPKATPDHLVRCCDCASFIPDTIGDGLGIGRCEMNGEGPRGRWKGKPALWARGERRCGDFRSEAASSTQRHEHPAPR